MIQVASRATYSSRPAGRVGYRKIFNESNFNESKLTLLLLSPLALVSFENQYSVITGEQYRTPLERYDFTAFVFVIDPATNFSVPVVSFEVGDTGVGDFITTSETGASRSNFTYEPPTRNTSVVVTIPSSTTYATVRRTARAQALTFLMFTINWLLTLCTLVITGIVANKRVVKDGVALLPVSIILSVPAIRSLYIGSPPFGIFFGTHRNLTTLFEALTLSLRRGGVLPTNDHCSGVCHGSLVYFRPGQTRYRYKRYRLQRSREQRSRKSRSRKGRYR